MKNKYIIIGIVAFLFMNTSAIAQVGIGTTTPDPSSILDLNSTTQGMLAPRMTSAQRIAISKAADGLIVFDLEEDSMYYFNGGSWIKLEGANTRNNYKLVKNIADLSDELAAGGGAKYLLNSTYLYEINGTILVNFPIDLNEAYVKGQDTRGDILFNNTGTALFSGAKGGNVRDLLVVGNGQPAFNINATASENLIVNSVIFTGCNSVGSLTNLGLVFFNISQFISCNSGLTAANITSLLFSNIFWTSSGTGTFLNLAGTFDDVQLSSGRVAVDVGEIGIDVSSNPIINNGGSINGVEFTGSGTRVNRYTIGSFPGYNFTKEWEIDTPGLKTEKDNVATGNLYITTNAPTTFTAANTPVKMSGTTAGLILFRVTSPTDNRLTYTGSKTRIFTYTASMSITAATNNKRFSFYFAKNGIILPETKQSRKIANGLDIGALSLSGVVELAPNDYVEVWVENINDTTSITAESLNLILK